MSENVPTLHDDGDATELFDEGRPMAVQRPLGQTFEPGQLLAGRYRVVRLIGVGGMGEVYEARDLDLQEDIAIKAVRGAAGTEDAYERLKREIQLARKITHPNVCRIFDLGRHDDANGTILFVTMELLLGTTLARLLAGRGRFTAAEALPIVRQIAAGLAAAHASGIVHRDLKTDNIIVEGDRVVITDFGIAVAEGADASAPQRVLGTPAYMAPEQCRGKRVTALSDVYALGVILYELVCGRRPFDGSEVFRKIYDPPPPPRLLVPDLDPVWEAVTLRCLEREPQARFATVSEVVQALDGHRPADRPADHHPADHRPPPTARRRLIALVLIAAAAASFAVWRLRSPAPVATSGRAGVVARPAVAVVGFHNISGRPEHEWLSTALAEMLATELAAGGRIRAIAGEDVQRARRELGVQQDHSPSAASLLKLSRNLDADLLVHGSFVAAGDAIRIDTRLVDATGRGRDLSVAESGPESDLFAAVARIGGRIRAAVGVPPAAGDGTAVALGILPKNPAAARAYAEGLSHLRNFDALRARDLLARAAAADPGHPMIRSALANAFTASGYDLRAKEELERAFELSAGLPREQRLLVEAGYRESVADWPQAMEIYRSLMRFFPDNLEYGLRLASVQTRSGDASGALETVRKLRELPAPLGSDPRIDVAEIDAAAALADYPRLEKAAAAAIETASRRGARLLAARAHSALGVALHRQGRTDASLAAQNRALAIYRDAGDRAAVGRSLVRIGAVHVYRGRNAEARPYFEEAARIGEDVGDAWLRAASWNNLAFCAFTRAEPAAARRLLNRMRALARENGDRKIEATALDNLGWASYLLGDLDTAERQFRESAAIAAAIKSKQLQAVAETNVADALLARGRLDQARALYEKALALRQQIGEKRAIAESQIALAAVAIEQAEPAEATALASEAVKWASGAKVGEVETSARNMLARALLLEGRLDDARRAIEAAEASSAERDNLTLRAQVAVTSAHIAAARGDVEAARERLAKTASIAGSVVPIRLEADLARAQLAPRRKAALRAVAAEAERLGFHLIARKARAER